MSGVTSLVLVHSLMKLGKKCARFGLMVKVGLEMPSGAHDSRYPCLFYFLNLPVFHLALSTPSFKCVKIERIFSFSRSMSR